MVVEAGQQPKHEHYEKLHDSVHNTNSGAANHNQKTVIEPLVQKKDKPNPLPEVNKCLFLFDFLISHNRM